MNRLARDDLLRGRRRTRWTRLPAVVDAVLHAGIEAGDPLVRRRQFFTNIVAYVAALNALAHFVTNAAHDFTGLLVVNVYNVAIFAFCVLNHRLHAHGDLVAAVTLITGIALGHSFVVFAFGTSSDLHFYFTLAGFALFLVGVENFRVFLVLYGIGLAALLAAVFLAPVDGFVLPGDAELRAALSFEAAMNAYLMNGVLFSFALTAQHRAEERSEALLTSILPRRIAERLKSAPDTRIADRAEDCSVLFADLVGFTDASRDQEPDRVVAYLDTIFSRFDAACERLGADKIKTIGDCYMAVGGLGGDPSRGSRTIGLLALELLKIVEAAPEFGGARLRIRAGLHSGPVTAGIIGNLRIAYDVWGDTVNVASRMESHGVPGRIHVSQAYRDLAAPHFDFEPRGDVQIRSVGPVRAYFLVAAKERSIG